MRPSDGSGTDEPLTAEEGLATSPDWSRDGRFIVHSQTKSGSSTGVDLWTLDMIDHGKPSKFLDTHFDETHASFSPDGHWIANQSNASGRNEVYVLAHWARCVAWRIR